METLEDVQEKIKDYNRDQLIDLIMELKSNIDSLEHLLFLKRSEKMNREVYGTPLFDEPEQAIDNKEEQTDEIDDTQVSAHKRKRGSRKPLPKDLPRETIVIDLSDEEKICPIHKTSLVKIGETKKEKLEIIPAKVRVLEELTPAYKCPCCSKDEADKVTIKKSNPIAEIIPKSFASPSLLAYIATAKYQDALPLYRLEKIFTRHGIDLDRTTMARWMISVGKSVQPLVNLMYDDLTDRKVIGCDETRVQVLKEENRRPEQHSYMWVTISMIGKPIILFQYHTSRGTKVLNSFLGGYKGTIVCDGLSTYDSFAAISDNIEIGACMAHIRRKFHHAHKALKKASPKQKPKTAEIMGIIGNIYKIEDEIKLLPPDEKLKARMARSGPLMAKARDWIDIQQNKCFPKSLLGKAISYANKQWDKMQLFLRDPLVPIDNNPTENAIRPFVLGRKNWLFAATVNGAEASANLYSLIESAKANGIEPFVYLNLIFKELPKVDHDLDLLTRLLPHNVSSYYDIETNYSPRPDKNSNSMAN